MSEGLRVAAIDVGTNSTKMTIADVSDNGLITVVDEFSEVTRLGRGVDSKRYLAQSSMDDTINAISRFKKEAGNKGSSEILITGTSALRDASNGQQFINNVYDKTNLTIEVINGNREASLAHSAIIYDPSLAIDINVEHLVFDIGGGSTELIIGKGNNILKQSSLDIGAVRLTERFLKDDPPTSPQITEANECIHGWLDDYGFSSEIQCVAGIGGTALNIAGVLENGIKEKVHGRRVTAIELSSLLERFISIPLDQRKNITGLEPARADIITAGVLILIEILNYINMDGFIVSTRGLRYGIIAEWAANRRKYVDNQYS